MAFAYTELLQWPLLLDQEAVRPEEATDALTGRSPVALATVCSRFDAVAVPYAVGRDALMTVERTGSVPCLRTQRRAFTLLVVRGTGGSLADLAGVEVLAGDTVRIELPPTAGVVWDTPPWRIGEPTCVPLREAGELRGALVQALQLYPAPEVSDEFHRC
jgi:hypothetical protein